MTDTDVFVLSFMRISSVQMGAKMNVVHPEQENTALWPLDGAEDDRKHSL